MKRWTAAADYISNPEHPAYGRYVVMVMDGSRITSRETVDTYEQACERIKQHEASF